MVSSRAATCLAWAGRNRPAGAISSRQRGSRVAMQPVHASWAPSARRTPLMSSSGLQVRPVTALPTKTSTPSSAQPGVKGVRQSQPSSPDAVGRLVVVADDAGVLSEGDLLGGHAIEQAMHAEEAFEQSVAGQAVQSFRKCRPGLLQCGEGVKSASQVQVGQSRAGFVRTMRQVLIDSGCIVRERLKSPSRSSSYP